jgi:predicted glycoside hydrolase/deacetylase ChbG (UPF0249 family)
MALSTLIINADDFGISSNVNRAILSSMEAGLVTSTSIMANMPGFEGAVEIVYAYPCMRDRVGLHLNLTQGRPLSQLILDHPRFCGPDGNFVFDRTRSLFSLDRGEEEAIVQEFRMQLDKVMAAGIRPVHIDSHHHMHSQWALAPLVSRLARDYGIPRIRLTRNMGRQPNFVKRLYKLLLNTWRLGGEVGKTDYFGDIADLLHFSRHRWPVGKFIEVMVHPQYDESGRLVDLDRKPLWPRLVLLTQHPVELYPKTNGS